MFYWMTTKGLEDMKIKFDLTSNLNKLFPTDTCCCDVDDQCLSTTTFQADVS